MIPVSLSIVGKALFELLCNIVYGYYEPTIPTDEARTATRRANLIAACDTLMKHMIGPGDLLDSSTRHEIVREAYAAFGSPINSRTLRIPSDVSSFAEYNRTQINHNYVTDGPFRDVVCAIVNFQENLDEDFFQSVTLRIQEKDQNRSLEDCQAMAVELTIVAASCDGIRAFYALVSLDDYPPVPDLLHPGKPAHFQTVSDYSSTPLQYLKSASWVPFLTSTDIRPEVFAKFHLDTHLWSFASFRASPISNATSSITTCQAIMDFLEVAYTPLDLMPRMTRVPGIDRHLMRGQIEVACAAYSRAKHCRF